MKRLLLISLACSLCLATAANAATEQVLNLARRLKIAITVPTGYSYEATPSSPGVALVKMENPVWKIAITAVVIRESDSQITTEAWQRSRLISHLAETLSESSEKNYNFLPLETTYGGGIYCTLTDSRIAAGETLPPDEYVHLTGGIKAWPGVYIVFQILSNDLTSEEYREAFRLFTDSFFQM